MSMRYFKNEPVKGAGSEPILSQREGEEGLMTWGQWTFQVEASLSSYGGSLYYVIHVDITGGGDAGEDGMYGQLSTGLQNSLEEAAEVAKRDLRLTVRSAHCEEEDSDLCLYERMIDLSPAIDQIVEVFRACNRDAEPC